MTAQIIDGKAVASAVKVEVASGVRALRRSPGLATVLVGDDPASRVYVNGKRRDAEEVGMVSIHHQLPADTTQEKLLELIASLNDDDKVDGILVQLPLPNGLDPEAAVKDADCVFTDTWVSMGDREAQHRHNILKPYQVNSALMAKAKPDALFMHCLPAHRGEEVTDEVMDGPQSVVFDEAENRLHAQKGLLAWCLHAEDA